MKDYTSNGALREFRICSILQILHYMLTEIQAWIQNTFLFIKKYECRPLQSNQLPVDMIYGMQHSVWVSSIPSNWLLLHFRKWNFTLSGTAGSLSNDWGNLTSYDVTNQANKRSYVLCVQMSSLPQCVTGSYEHFCKCLLPNCTAHELETLSSWSSAELLLEYGMR